MRVKSLVHVITEYKLPSLQSVNISVKLDDRKCLFVVFHFQNTLRHSKRFIDYINQSFKSKCRKVKHNINKKIRIPVGKKIGKK